MGNNEHIEFIDHEWQNCKLQGYEGSGWYFWDETEAFCNGPFPTYNDANSALQEYAEALNRGAFVI